MLGSISFLVLRAGGSAGAPGASGPYHKTSETVEYKCLFNHELLIVCHKRIQSTSFGDRLLYCL